jgi:GNAT superfamily N-acetyltransferase
MTSDFRIRPGTIDEAVKTSLRVPELVDPWQNEEYIKRMEGQPHIILVAELEGGEIIGFKAGYEREDNGSFYSWIGGVRPEWRKEGVAESLLHGMEVWARAQGYKTLRFNTLNRHRNMLHFGIKHGFNIINFTAHERVEDHRIWLEKVL